LPLKDSLKTCPWQKQEMWPCAASQHLHLVVEDGADFTIFPSGVCYASACPTNDMQIFEASTVFSLRISPGILDQIVSTF
jgi:hypothetical protein